MDLRGSNSGQLEINAFVGDINGLNIVLTEYLNALTDVCKLGILLAGRLDRQLQSKSASQMRQQLACKPTGLDKRVMTQIGSFYSGIMGKMGPLWQQTICGSEEGEEGSADSTDVGGCQLSERQYLVS